MNSEFLKCKECKRILLKNNIKVLKDFLRWSLNNHPDKGGEISIFQEVSNCVDKFFKDDNKECDKYDYSDKSNSDSSHPPHPHPRKKPSNSSDKSHSHKKPSKKPKRSPKDCPDGYERNPDTGKCRKKCTPEQARNPVTGRCRKSPKSKSKSPNKKF